MAALTASSRDDASTLPDLLDPVKVDLPPRVVPPSKLEPESCGVQPTGVNSQPASWAERPPAPEADSPGRYEAAAGYTLFSIFRSAPGLMEGHARFLELRRT